MGNERAGIPFCVNHPGVRARARCVSCGNYICEGCLRENHARAMCPSCWERLRRAPEEIGRISTESREASPQRINDEGGGKGAPPVYPRTPHETIGKTSQPRPVGPTVYACCSYHPGVRAVARCVNCGAFLCAQCRRIDQGKRYCKDCYNFLVDKRMAVAPSPAGIYPYYPSGPSFQHSESSSGYPRIPGGQQAPGYPYPAVPAPSPKLPYPYISARPLGRSALENAQWKLWPGILFLPVPFIASGAVTYLMNKGPELTLGAATLLLSMVVYTMFTFFAVITVSRYGNATESLGLITWDVKSSLAMGLVGGVVCYWLSMAFALLSYASLHNLEWVEKWLEGLFEVNMKSGVSGVDLIIAFLLIVVAAPICEEIFFRGYLYPPMRRFMGRGAAIIVNALLFSLVHFSLFGLMSRMVAGCIFCLLYEYKENLAAPIVAHAVNNFIAFMLPLITFQSMRLLRLG